MYKSNKTVIERRKHKRYKIKEGAFAAINPNHCQLIGQITDMSMGGLAFTYIDDDVNENNEKEQNHSIDSDEYDHATTILLSSFDYYVEDIKFNTVEDIEIKDNIAFSFIKLRKRRIKFNGLTSKQAFDLHFYLKNNTIEKFDDPFSEN